jgi:putative peptidoglycan lipid II flippase
MLPALFGVSVSQINLLLDTVLASFLPTGSVSWLYYSDRLTELPLGVFGIAIATVILPRLSRLNASDSAEHYSATLDWAMRAVLIIGVPASIALLLLAEPILITLFQYGALEPGDVAMAALSLRAYSVGLLAFMLVKVLAPGFYARQDMVTPVRIGITAMVANMVMNLAFVVPLYLFFNIGHVGLALATSLSAWLNAGLLLRGLRRIDVLSFQPGWARFFTRLACATLAMVLTLLWLAPPESDWQSWSWWQRGAQMAILVCAGLVTYAVVQLALGARLRDITAGSGSAG